MIVQNILIGLFNKRIKLTHRKQAKNLLYPRRTSQQQSLIHMPAKTTPRRIYRGPKKHEGNKNPNNLLSILHCSFVSNPCANVPRQPDNLNDGRKNPRLHEHHKRSAQRRNLRSSLVARIRRNQPKTRTIKNAQLYPVAKSSIAC